MISLDVLRHLVRGLRQQPVIDSISYTVDEGTTKLVELINTSGGNLSRMALSLVIFEVDGTYKEV